MTDNDDGPLVELERFKHSLIFSESFLGPKAECKLALNEQIANVSRNLVRRYG